MTDLANLLTNASTTGQSIIVGGGPYTFSAVGSFGGATIQLELLGPDDATWLAIPDASFTANGVKLLFLGKGSKVRAAISGGTPSGLYADLRGS